MRSLADSMHSEFRYVRSIFIFGVPILVCYLLVARPVRFGLAVGALLLAANLGKEADYDKPLYRTRSFFGVLSVGAKDDGEEFDELVHGTTLHGLQYRNPARQREATTYYHRTGPIGRTIWALQQAHKLKDFAVVGLGTGTLASYGEKGQSLTYYEIDKAVVKIANNTDYFTYLHDCRERGVDLQIVLGDARLLREAADQSYDLLIIDAFSSDAIPIHLITREALQLYFQKLREDGVLAIHISNRYLDLEPVLGNLAKSLNVWAFSRMDGDIAQYPGKSASHWVVLAKKPEVLEGITLVHRAPIWGQALESLGALPGPGFAPASLAFKGLEDDSPIWLPARMKPSVGVWDDDFSNLLSVFIWKSGPAD